MKAMGKWTVEANADTIATIEHHYPVQFWPERTTTRHGKFKTKYGNRVPLCEHCGYSIKDERYNFCPNCGTEIVDDKR